MTSGIIVIDRRFRGPPQSGNGGYVCGRLASYIDGGAAVRLRVPPPLEVELRVEQTLDATRLLHGDTVVAEARAATVQIDTPCSPTYSEAEEASRSFRGFKSHWFPSCFVCGPERELGDGLRIFPGPLPERRIVACPWVPDPSLADSSGRVAPEFLWAALDCPGGWAALDCPGGFAFDAPPSGAILLGELAASLSGSVSIGERCVLVAWELGCDGRKHFVGTALFSDAGRCRGVARAVWFDVPGAPQKGDA